MGSPPPSAAYEAALQQCLRLSHDERCMLLEALGAGACLEAWCDGYNGPGTKLPEDSSPPPPSPSYPVSAWWPSKGCVASEVPVVQKQTSVTGCPWCRRPVVVRGHAKAPEPHQALPDSTVASSSQSNASGRHAYVTLLYGPSCHEYFLGALVLGRGLQRHAPCSKEAHGMPVESTAEKVLLYTPDVPNDYLKALSAVGWTNVEVSYLRGVSRALFHDYRKSRFVDVFTKIRALQLTQYDKIMLLDLDLLIRSPSMGKPLDCVFDLPTPAAMVRAPPVKHGESVSYAEMWTHPTRRKGDKLPFHQQASGINAGVMLLKPDLDVLKLMEIEVRDWYHPEHYATYMPEQEYLSRFYGTFDRWTHIDCSYNFEIDKNERVSHDFTEAHEVIRARDAASREQDPESESHPGAAVLHFSGMPVKPWKLLWQKKDPENYDKTPSFLVSSLADLRSLRDQYVKERTDGGRLEGYNDRVRLWAAMLEWLEQFVEAAESISCNGELDVLQLVQARLEADAVAAAAQAERKRNAEDGKWSWDRSAWARNES